MRKNRANWYSSGPRTKYSQRKVLSCVPLVIHKVGHDHRPDYSLNYISPDGAKTTIVENAPFGSLKDDSMSAPAPSAAPATSVAPEAHA